MKRRVASLFLATVMLLALLPAMGVSAEVTYADPDSSWSVSGTGPAEVKIATGEAFSGDNSLYVKRTDGDDGFWNQITYTGGVAIENGASYTIEFYGKLVSGRFRINLGGVVLQSTDGTLTQTDTAKEGWKKYSATVTATGTNKMLFDLQYYAKCEGYVDDITITKNAGGSIIKVMVEDFEEVTLAAYTGEKWEDMAQASGKTLIQTATWESYSGNNSLYVAYPDKTQFYGANMLGFMLETGTEYTLTFYAKIVEGRVGFDIGGNHIHTNESDWTVGPQEASGWKKYSKTITPTASQKRLEVQTYYGTKAYIDDVTLVKHNADETTTVVFEDDFDSAAPSITYTDLDGSGWTTSTSATVPTFDAKIAEGMAYTGDTSLYVNYTRPSNPSGIWMKLTNSGIPAEAVKANTEYIVTYYAKPGNNGNVTVKLGNAAPTGTWQQTANGVTPEDAEKAADGWLKFSGSITTSNSAKLEIVFGYTGGEWYFDDFSVVEVNGITYSSLDGSGWTTSTSATVPTFDAKIAEGMAYTGDTSLYVNYTRPSNPSGIWMKLTNSGIPAGAVKANTEYIVTYYAKPGNSGNVTVKLGNAAPTGTWQQTANGVTPKDPDKAAEGWLKFSGSITTSNSAKLEIVFGYTGGEWYFDDFSVIEASKAVGYTAAEGWSKQVKDSAYSCSYDIAVGESYSGNRSLHANYVRPATATDNYMLLTYNNCPQIKAGTTYTVTYYGKYGTGNPACKLGNVAITLTSDEPEDTEKAADGWLKYTGTVTTSNTAKLQFSFQYANGDYYIDDITIEEDGVAEPVLEYDFETGADYDVTLQVFDGTNAISALDESLSGKTVTAKAVLINNNAQETLDGQVILAIYQNSELKLCAFAPARTGITSSDGTVAMETELIVPTLTAETEGEYRIKAMLWNSLQGLMPLTGSLNID